MLSGGETEEGGGGKGERREGGGERGIFILFRGGFMQLKGLYG